MSTFEFLEEDQYRPEDNPTYKIERVGGGFGKEYCVINGEPINPVCLELVKRSKFKKKNKKSKYDYKVVESITADNTDDAIKEFKKRISEMLEKF